MWVIMLIWKRNARKILLLGWIVLLMAASGTVVLNRQAATGELGRSGYLSLIIDDFGNHGDGTEAMLQLNVPLAAAVIPFLPHSQSDAELAHRYGKEVILHLPMEAVLNRPDWLGPGAISAALSTSEIQNRLHQGLAQLHWAVGINNHMGSRAMQDERVVAAILAIVREKNLIFVDSRTTIHSVAPALSRELDLPYLGRDVFLELTKNKADICRQLQRLGQIALRRGYAIGIGHVGHDGGSVTAEAIRETYPELQALGVRFIPLTQMRAVVMEYNARHGRNQAGNSSPQG